MTTRNTTASLVLRLGTEASATARPCPLQCFNRQNGEALVLTLGNALYVTHYNVVDLALSDTVRIADLTCSLQRIRYSHNPTTTHCGVIKVYLDSALAVR
jgi:hypothetical protein